MLYPYPWTGVRNWIHESLLACLIQIHYASSCGEPDPQWPGILPSAHRAKLRSKTGLKSRLDNYSMAFRMLGTGAQGRVSRALLEQNMLETLLRGQSKCERIEDLPKAVRSPAKELFRFAFGLLTDLGVRDEQYVEIYQSMHGYACAFCGCEYFDAPDAPREALDHYLAFSHYPFAGANLRNLVPMGHKCNSQYKLAKDVIRRNDGTCRICPDPYDSVSVHVDLDGSEPFAGTQHAYPRWAIRLTPGGEATETWNEVFQIRARYRRDILDPMFLIWLGDFRMWVRLSNSVIKTEPQLLRAIKNFAKYHQSMGLRDRAFLKAAVFQMLWHHCKKGNRRIIDLLVNLVGSKRKPVGNAA
jgi:hypothetical protein